MINRITKMFNPQDFTWTLEEGQSVQLTELSRDDLIQVACSCMAAVEQFEELQASMSGLVNNYHSGSLFRTIAAADAMDDRPADGKLHS